MRSPTVRHTPPQRVPVSAVAAHVVRQFSFIVHHLHGLMIMNCEPNGFPVSPLTSQTRGAVLKILPASSGSWARNRKDHIKAQEMCICDVIVYTKILTRSHRSIHYPHRL